MQVIECSTLWCENLITAVRQKRRIKKNIKMKNVKLLTTFAIASVVLFVGCQKNDSAPFEVRQNGNPLQKSSQVMAQPVALGLAGNYAILSKTGITTTGVTSIVGNIAVSPIAATAMTGFGLIADGTGQFSKSSLVSGQIYAANYGIPTPALLTATVLDMEAAYTDAAGRAPDFTELGTGNIGGMTLALGVYKWSGVVSIPTNVTLLGGANDVWIFQISGGLTVASAKSVILSGGAKAKNIFWQVAGIATLGTTADFSGIILSKTAIVMQTGAVLNGRALAQTAVTMDANAVTEPAK